MEYISCINWWVSNFGLWRIYVDAVVNHMSGLGRVGTADGGSTYNGDALDFPGVPFSAEHFTPRDQCPSGDGILHNNNNSTLAKFRPPNNKHFRFAFLAVTRQCQQLRRSQQRTKLLPGRLDWFVRKTRIRSWYGGRLFQPFNSNRSSWYSHRRGETHVAWGIKFNLCHKILIKVAFFVNGWVELRILVI